MLSITTRLDLFDISILSLDENNYFHVVSPFHYKCDPSKDTHSIIDFQNRRDAYSIHCRVMT